MARRAREVSSTGLYAVTVKTNGAVFGTEAVRSLFKECFEKFLGEGARGVKFSDTGAFMLISESERGISADMKSIMTSFSRSCNKLMNTTGKIFSERFGSIPVETPEREAECMAYIASEAAEPMEPMESMETAEPEKPEETEGAAPAEVLPAAEPAEEKTKKAVSKPRRRKKAAAKKKQPETTERQKQPETPTESPAEERGAKRWHDDIPFWLM